VTLIIKVGSSEGMMNFAIPHLTIEPIVERLNTRFWYSQSSEEATDTYREDLEGQLEKALIPIAARVGTTQINISDFVYLQVGDIIPLDTHANMDLDIMVGNLLKFKGKPGLSRGRNAVQITKLLTKED